MEALAEHVTKAQQNEAYCKQRLATELNCAMMQAVTGRSPKMIEALLDWGADPSSFKNWYPVSLSAVDSNCEEVVDVLLARGIDFSGTCPYGSPLHSAARHGNLNILKKLLALGVLDVNSKNDIQGASPLHIATLMKRKEAVELLLQNGATVDATDSNFRTSLHHAAMQGSTDIVDLLIKAGADIHAVDSDSKTPWMHASVSMHTALADKIIAMEDDVNRLVFPFGATYLHLAAAAGLTQCCEYLLAKGQTIGAKDDIGNTPLISAVLNSRTHIVRYLLTKDFLGADVNHMNTKGRSALACAMELPHNSVSTMMMDTLKESGADVNAACYGEGKTLLHFHLSEQDCIAKVEWLINNGANLNLVSERKETALMEAVNWVGSNSSYLHPVELLLNHNVDMRTSAVVSEEGCNPLKQALQHGNAELASLLFHSGASLSGIGQWLKTGEVKSFITDDTDFRDLCAAIENRIPTSINLQNMARLAVLGSLGHSEINTKIEQLDLPVLVKKHLDLQTYQRVSKLDSVLNHC